MKKAAIGAGALVVVLLIVVAVQPSSYHVERSTVINAPAEVVFAEVSDFKRWVAWSPWEKLDPNMEKTFTGEPGEVGASYAWKGNDQAGSGSMTITEVDPPKKLVQKLKFIEPFASEATTAFNIAPEGDGVKVTWSMEGHNGFMGKAMSLVLDMDAMIGADYEKGLAALKTIAEENANKAAAGPAVADAAGAVPADAAAGDAPADGADADAEADAADPANAADAADGEAADAAP